MPPWSNPEPTLETVRFYDNLTCFIFLFDFAGSLTGSHPRRERAGRASQPRR